MKENGKTVQIIVAAHKPYRMPDDPLYLSLQVGAEGKESIGYQRDDEGDNISALNPYFCELTGLYWGWKNLNSDYVCLVHYRRYFSNRPNGKVPWAGILKEAELSPLIPHNRLFVPAKRRYYIETLYSHYAHTHYAGQLDETRKIIGEKYPDYLPAYDRTVNQRWGYMFNMLIAEKSLLDDYCSWLFDILFDLRTRIGKEQEANLDTYQGRFYGRISEIIFNVWLSRRLEIGNLSPKEIKEIPFISTEKVDWKKKGTAFLKAKFIGERYQGSF